MKSRRVALSLGAAVAVLAVLLLVPLPVSRVRQTGLVQVDPEATSPVHVQVPGIGSRVPGVLAKLHVRDGQQVEEGHILAEFHNREVDDELNEARAQLSVEETRLRAAQEQLQASREESEKNKLRTDVARGRGECDRLIAKVAACEEIQGRLVLRAPRAGMVLSPPRPDEVGRQWDRERAVPFCSIVDARRLRVLVPVSPADYRLLKDDSKRAHHKGTNLSVDLRIQGLGQRTWKGRVGELPPAEAHEVPPALTQRAGGPVAIKQGTSPNAIIPQDQIYLVPVDVVNADAAVLPGARAQVKIHCAWRPAAWWAWRTLSTTFDLGL